MSLSAPDLGCLGPTPADVAAQIGTCNSHHRCIYLSRPRLIEVQNYPLAIDGARQ